MAYIVLHAGHLDEGIDHCNKALKMDSRFWSAHYDLGRIHELRGDCGKAAQELETSVALSSGNYRAVAALGRVQALCGRQAEATGSPA